MDTGIAIYRIDFGVCIALMFVTAVTMPFGSFFVCKATSLRHRNFLPPVA